IIGRLFREFAVTLSVAIGISLLVSLSTTPMMCSRLLRRRSEEKPGRLARWSEGAFERVRGGYEHTLGWTLRHPLLMLVVLLLTIAMNVVLYVKVPKGFFPTQDTGRVIGFVRADQSISFQAMKQKMNDFFDIVMTDPAVDSVTGFTGSGGF